MVKDKGKQPREWNSPLPYNLRLEDIRKGAFGSSSTQVANFTFYQTQY